MSDSNQYTDLIAGWHVDKPKFGQMVYETTQPFAAIGAQARSLSAAFDLDQAVGVQLDALGVRIGISRRVRVTLQGVYYSLDFDGVGLDQGVWQGPYDPDSGISLLDDETYRAVLRAKIAANHWDGSNQGARSVLDQVFSDGTLVVLEDHQDMSMTIGLSGKMPTPIMRALLINGYLSVKPAAVRIAYYITSTADGALFGFDIQSDAIAGFDDGVFGVVSTGSPL